TAMPTMNEPSKLSAELAMTIKIKRSSFHFSRARYDQIRLIVPVVFFALSRLSSRIFFSGIFSYRKGFVRCLMDMLVLLSKLRFNDALVKCGSLEQLAVRSDSKHFTIVDQ